MAVIAQESIEQVKAVADMVEIVGARTQLRKSGARWMGRCPFHEDRTPSFSVDPADKLFYCHGCGKGGDLISFVRETEGLDFVGAIEWLADRYRIPLEYEETSPQVEAGRKRKERLLALLEQAATYYERTLWESPAGEPVRAYLVERGLAEEVCKEFRLGLSPGGVVLAQKARDKGYAQEELVASGLVNRRGNDYYAGRLVFPLADGRGRVLGFGARRLRDDDPIPAKYVNSPESELFRKSSLVYGLHLSRATIAKEDRAVVVEGYTDVLALAPGGAQAGRGLDGHRAHRAAAEGAPAADAPPLPVLRRRRGRGSGHAARHGVGRSRRVRSARGADSRSASTLPTRSMASRSGLTTLCWISAPSSGRRDRADPPKQARLRAGAEVYSERRRGSPERADAARYASDRLDVPSDSLGVAPRTVAGRHASPKLLDAGDRLSARLLAACSTSPELVERYLRPLDDRHFDNPEHRRLRAHLVGTPPWRRPTSFCARAELGAIAEEEHLDADVARELFLRLEERLVRRELADLSGDDLARTVELQGVLAKIRDALDKVESELR